MKTISRNAILYLRLSDLRNEQALDGREAALRAQAELLGWTVVRVAIENDMTGHRPKPASAFKRKKVAVKLPDGTEDITYRVLRPVFQSVVSDLKNGAANALLAEDLDRIARDPRDLEDLIDLAEHHGSDVQSASAGEINLRTSDGITMARVLMAFANKSSRDTARRVSSGRKRHAENGSYGGGKRPYGYRVDQAAPKYAKSLLVVPDEADVIRQAADDLLHGVSLASIAAHLRDRGVPTARGARWRAETLRDIMLKPSIAGLIPFWGEDAPRRPSCRNETPAGYHTAKWEPIIDRDVWERLRDMLLDPSRRTNHSNANAPRYLLSGIALCGICADGTLVRVNGAGYCCSGGKGHLHRSPARCDDYVERIVIARLSQPDTADLLKPAPRPGIDTPALRVQVRKLRKRKSDLAAMFADGTIDKAGLRTGTNQIKRRLEAAEQQLTAATEPDHLAEFRDPLTDAAVVWEGLSLGRRREIVRALVNVTFVPCKALGGKFNTDGVQIEWRSDVDGETAAAA